MTNTLLTQAGGLSFPSFDATSVFTFFSGLNTPLFLMNVFIGFPVLFLVIFLLNQLIFYYFSNAGRDKDSVLKK